MDKKKIIIFLLIISFVLSFFTLHVKAEEIKNDIYCPLCSHRDDDDPLYRKERQFYQKIKIIKSIFGDSIDEVALAAAVLHRYSGPDVAYEREYDSDFDEEAYKSTWQNIFDIKMNVTEFGLTEDEQKQVEENDKIALLTSAAIVMIDSNHFGTYSDVCFKDALAGNSLVNNDGGIGVFGSFINAFVCHVYQGLNVANPIEYVSNMFYGDNILVTAESAKNRLINTKNICENGFVGGLYSNVRGMKDDDKKSRLKKVYAQQIIDLSNYYKRLYGSGVEEENGCSLNVAGSTGEFASWRQFDKEWKKIDLGGSSSVGNAGCLVTSIAMQIARSGTKIGTLPSGYTEFNPGAFVTSLNNNNGFSKDANYAWRGYEKIAPNWGVGDFVTLNESNNKNLAIAISRELSTGYGEGNYQKFLVLQIKHDKSNQHWVAVNGVSNDTVTIFDPAMDGTTLDENYSNWIVKGYRVMYAKDVSIGQTGTTSNNACFKSNGSGEIKIPEEYSDKGIFTITEIDKFNWVYDSGELYKKWIASGGKYRNGIAVIDGRFLIACTNTFGKVGDKIDFYLEDGTKIPTIMFDTKDQTTAHGNPANKWGHYTDGVWDVLEFEVSSKYYHTYRNPGNGNNSWYKEWSGKRVASATNLGGGGISTDEASGGSYCLNGQAMNSAVTSNDSSENAYQRIRNVKSSTGMLVAVDYDRKYFHFFRGSAGAWQLEKSFRVVTGRNRYFGYEVDRNGFNVTPIGLFTLTDGIDVVSTQGSDQTLTYTVRINSNKEGNAAYFHGVVVGFIPKSADPGNYKDLVAHRIKQEKYNVSGGCVELTNEDAKWLFNTVKRGTPGYIWTEKPATNNDGFENYKLKKIMVSKKYSDVTQLTADDRLYVYGSSGPLPYKTISYP